MSHPIQYSVRLPFGWRFFRCPRCWFVGEHPPVFPEHLLEGHVYCGSCGEWARIEDYRTFASEEEFEAAMGERQK